MKKGCLSVILIFITLGAIGMCSLAIDDQNKGPGQSRATFEKKDIPIPSDKDLFTSYYRSLMTKVDEADATYEPFRKALQRGEPLEATSIALRIKSPTLSLWGDIRSIEIPELQNKEAQKKLDQAREAIAGAYLYKANSVKDWIKFSESQDMKKLAELKNRAEDMKTLLLGGTTFLVEAGNMVGVKVADLRK